jgi:hypothetical protein
LVSEKDVVSEDIFHSTPVGGREKDAVIGKCHGTVLTDEVGMVEKYTVFFLMLIYFFLSFCMCNSLILHHFRVTCRLKKKKKMLNWHNAHGGRFRIHRFFLLLKVNGGSI